MERTFDEINEKIRSGKVVVMTAEEVSKMAEEKTAQEIFEEVDVVTTGTFSPMCSSGAFMNFGHTFPPIRMEHVTLNGVEAHAGLAAVDVYMGATAESKEDPTYGGAHVIEELINGKDVHLIASAKGTDCYPRKRVNTYVNKDEMNEFYLFNPRNVYQNYNVAVNSANKTIYTYIGKLLANLENAMYATSGELSPLINDPQMRTIGVGTRIFIGGAKGYVVWNGTQYDTTIQNNAYKIPTEGARTLALIGNAKEMSTKFLRAAYIKNYGVTLYMGIGVAIPVLDIDMAKAVSIRDEEIDVNVLDYSDSKKRIVAKTNYKVLKSGFIKINGKKVRTGTLSSMQKAREIAQKLKNMVKNGEFLIAQPVSPLPSFSKKKSLKVRKRREKFLTTSSCLNCGSCVGVCPTGALHFSEKDVVVFEKRLCDNCGLCEDVCPVGLVKKDG